MSCKEKRKVTFNLRYHTYNKHKYPDNYAHDLLFLFYPFHNKSELLSEYDETHTSKLINQQILGTVIKINKLLNLTVTWRMLLFSSYGNDF